MTNFDFLKNEEKFNSFADVAISAEKILNIDHAASILNCRRAMEFALKWMYSVEKFLVKPWDDKLSSLLSTDELKDLIDPDLLTRMHYIRKVGNYAAHSEQKVTKGQAELCLQNLHCFMDYIAYCYGTNYEQAEYNPELLVQKSVETVQTIVPAEIELQLEQLMKENASLRDELTEYSKVKRETYTPNPLDISEFETRKLYIDVMLHDAGWIKGRNWREEYEIPGMPNRSEVGFADYVLTNDNGKVLAVIEAKKTCVDLSVGRHQAKLYADLIAKNQNFRPVVFLSNGFETRIIDNQYPERKVSTIYSRRDLEKLFNLQRMRTSLKHVTVDRNIAGRYYQINAVKAVCDSFGEKNRRKALLVMATGSGKTRTVIALTKVLLEHGWVKNILFLADRTSLVTQAKRSFVNLLPDLSVTNLCEEKDNYGAHCVFSTYQTMMNCIDSVHDDQGKLFTCGHFDLVICDEAHRSIYNKYKDIFSYFDAPLVGLTATPKDEIEKNTYDIFELQNRVPTYGYELAQAVKDGFLVDYMSIETKLKFMEEGIAYDELSEEDKAQYEATFTDVDGELPERIASSALNQWLFNEDTIKEVLNIFMTHGLKLDYGNKIGKSIIFAKNHKHAEKIYEVFNKEYPHLAGYAAVIDNKINYAQSLIDEFSDPKKLPQIAISVDMLDTGIDVPEALNLVFFKKVMSKAKFWQMIGRGTRLCPELIDGMDKDKFYIFDFCSNFDFFRMNPGKEVPIRMHLQGAIFQLEFEIVYKLQDIDYHTERLLAYRKALVDHMVSKVKELQENKNFAVNQHLKYVEKYALEGSYDTLAPGDTAEVKVELSPLIRPDNDDPKALRFDALMYGIELAYLVGKKYNRARKDLVKQVKHLASLTDRKSFPEVTAEKEFLEKLVHTDYIETAGINEFEHIRERLRDLMKYVERTKITPLDTDFDDVILGTEWHEAELENDDLKDYKAKAEYYIRQHQDNEVISKLRNNVPMNADDIKALEKILWSEVGTQEDYQAEYGEKPLGEFVREIVGLDMAAAKAAFAEYLDETYLDSRQIYFVNQIVEFIVYNGMMKDLSVLRETPFTDRGSVVELFKDLNVWTGICKVINQINANALAA